MSDAEDRFRPANAFGLNSMKRWSALIGLAIGLAGAIFVVGTVARDWEQVSHALSGASPVSLLLALGSAGLAMTGIGFAWHTSLHALGARLPLVSSMRGYFVGQLGKYAPGGVWAIMGRGEWARSGGVPGALAYTSVVLSMGSAYLAALTLTAVLLPLSGSIGTEGGRYLSVLLLLPVGYALLHPKILQRILAALRKVTTREFSVTVPPWRRSALIVLQQVPSWVLIGFASLAIATGMGAPADPLNVMWATTVAWIVGFMALPTPGGLGVREAVFVVLASSLPAGIGAAVAVVARLTFIVVDAAGAAVTTLIISRRREPTGVRR